MKKFWSLLIIATLFFFVRNDEFSKNNVDIILSLGEHFKVAFCVFEKEAEKKILGGISKKIYPAKNKLLTTSLGFHEIAEFLHKDADCVKHGGKTMIILRMSNYTIMGLQKLSQGKSLSLVTWIMFSEQHFMSEGFKNIHIPFDCEFIYVHRKNELYFLTEIYRVTNVSNFDTYALGNWSKDSGLTMVDLPFYARRNNLGGHVLQAVVNNNQPYITIERNEGGKSMFKGYFFEIWTELEKRVNFRTEFPEKYFDKDPKTILENEAVDVALAKISNDPDGFKQMDFSVPIRQAETYAFGYRGDKQLDWDSYLKPFSTNIWLVILVWMIFFSIAFALLYRIAWNFLISERKSQHYVYSFSESVLTVFRAICMQGAETTPEFYSCRVLFLAIYLTSSVVTSAFSAALFSLLTIPKSKSQYSILNKVLPNRRYKIALSPNLDFQRALEGFSDLDRSGESILKARFLEAKLEPHILAEEGLRQLCKNRYFIFVNNLPEVLHFAQNITERCREKIVPIEPCLFKEYISFGFKKKSPYRKIIDLHLTRMMNEGTMRRIFANFWPRQLPHVQDIWVRATFADVSPLLFVLTGGVITGVVILVIETIIIRLRKKKRKISNVRTSDNDLKKKFHY